jgi:hypothetical protein
MTFLLTALSSVAVCQDWARFRGPDGLGQAPWCDPPTTWTDTENIAWKTELPVAGVSCPIVFGDKIFLTGYSGLDRWDDDKRDNVELLKQHVLCLDFQGNILWNKQFDASDKQKTGRVLRWHGFASHTPATDGERVYAFFGTTGVMAFDMDGNKVWEFTDVGEGTHNYGSAASVMLCDEKLIVPAAIESRTLIALNKDTGEVIWRQADSGEAWEGFRWGYSTPVVAEVDGKKQLVMGIMNGVAGFDAEDGHEIWAYYYQEKNKGHSYPCTSPFVIDGVAYFSIANSHKANDTMAIKLSGARGDLQKGDANVLWHTEHGSYVGGPVYHEGNLYLNHIGNNSSRAHQGFYCLNAETGETLYWAKRSENMKEFPSLIYASGLLCKDRIYVPTVSEGTYVIAAKPEFKILAHNVFENDDTNFSASPVPLSKDKLLLRSDKYLYCIGN